MPKVHFYICWAVHLTKLHSFRSPPASRASSGERRVFEVPETPCRPQEDRDRSMRNQIMFKQPLMLQVDGNQHDESVQFVCEVDNKKPKPQDARQVIQAKRSKPGREKARRQLNMGIGFRPASEVYKSQGRQGTFNTQNNVMHPGANQDQNQPLAWPQPRPGQGWNQSTSVKQQSGKIIALVVSPFF